MTARIEAPNREQARDAAGRRRFSWAHGYAREARDRRPRAS